MQKIFYHNLFFIYLWAKYHFLEKVIFIWVSKSQPKIILVCPTKIAKNKSNTRRKRNFLLIILINIFIWSFLLEKCNEDPYRSKYTTVFCFLKEKDWQTFKSNSYKKLFLQCMYYWGNLFGRILFISHFLWTLIAFLMHLPTAMLRVC